MRIAGHLLLSTLAVCLLNAEPLKQHSALFTPAMRERAKANAARYPWAAELAKGITQRAEPWRKLSDDELWNSIFGPKHLRSHMVWSSGYCPACRKPVPMYDWKMDTWNQPWKVRCPHCREQFPKNDYAAFYKSGLDEHGNFEPARANRALLFNTEHPNPADPRHTFGVDDGDGYSAEGHRWYFIAAYMQYAQFGTRILDGIENLSAAYAITGDKTYAHKAAILIDRLADNWPDYDFAERGLVYERQRYGGGRSGYVTYSINSAWEAGRIVMAYDQIFDALAGDHELTAFLAAKSQRYRLANPKATAQDIQRNIETRILRDVLAHPDKIRTNYPGTESTLAIIHTVLDWPANRPAVMKEIDDIVVKSTAVDGLSGEKGLNGYAIIAPVFLTQFLEMYARADEKLLPELLARHPKLRETYRFFVDTWVDRKYYPHSGDCGSFAIQDTRYVGAPLPDSPAAMLEKSGLPNSGHSFFWRFYQATKEPFYLQLSYLANGRRTTGLPYDLFSPDPAAVENDVRTVTARHGELPQPGSINKPQWRIAILRSPGDPARGAVWLDYDSIPYEGIRNHYHYDAMNIGLYAGGLDLLPEFGYPAVQFGDWHTPQARWHVLTAAHNTVTVDGHDQYGGPASTTLWADGANFRAVRASSPDQIKGKQYERTLAMVDLPDHGFYALDVFRVIGGKDHAKFLRGHFSTLATTGLHVAPAPDYGHNTLMRRFQTDASPTTGWSADWKVEDRRGYLAPGTELHLRHTDLTRNAQASTAESWSVMSATSTEEIYIPTVMTRRQTTGSEPLASTFVGVLEPYGKAPTLRATRRLDLETTTGAQYPDANVAIECTRADGGKDLWITADAENPLQHQPSLTTAATLIERSNRVALRGEMAFVRWSATGTLDTLAAAKASSLTAGDVTLELARPAAFVEFTFSNGQATLTTGDPADVKQLLRRGKRIPWQAQPRSHRSSQP